MTINDIIKDESTREDRLKLEKEYEKLVSKMSHQVFRYHDFIIYHIIVPSNKPGEVSYDVIIELKTSSFIEGGAFLRDVPMRLFSNCPSFIFGFAYNYNKSGAFCDWLKDKFSSELALTKAPTKPQSSPVERSTYLAIHYMVINGIDAFSVAKTIGRRTGSLLDIAKGVRSQAEIMQGIAERAHTQKLKKQRQREDDSEQSGRRSRSSRGTSEHTKTTKAVHKVSSNGTKVKSSAKTTTTKSAKNTKSY